jgi:hypothetical protein
LFVPCLLLALDLVLGITLDGKGLNPGNVEWFANAIEIGAIKLPELQGQHKSLQNKVQDMQCQKQELERSMQIINNRITIIRLGF